MMELLQYEFMRNAVMAAALASVACGIIGVYVVVKRIVFISGGIAHAAFGGIGLGYFLGVNPVLTLIPYSLASAVLIGLISKKAKISEDNAIGIFWAVGMALGVMFISLTPGYAPDLFSYLFGNILTVPFSDVILMLVLDAIIILTVFLLYKEFLALSFDEEYAETRGLPVLLLNLVLLCLIALTIVVLIRIVGIILVIALLTIPAAISRNYSRSLGRMMLISTVLGVVITFCGLLLSYYFDLASGAAIILFAGAVYLLSLLPGVLRRGVVKE